MRKTIVCRLIIVLGVLGVFFSNEMKAQYIKNTYFMDGVEYRMQLNPALTPNRGYIHLPVLGGLNMSASSNSLSFGDIKDIIENEILLDQSSYISDKFISKLKKENKIGVAANVAILSAGWYYKKNFWSVGINFRQDGELTIPKDQFVFIREAKKVEDNDLSKPIHAAYKNQKVKAEIFTELSLGWARTFDKLSVGAKGKLLLGHQRLNVNVNEVSLNYIPNVSAEMKVEAEIEGFAKSIDYGRNSSGRIEDMKFKGNKLGCVGMGLAFDLGASYQLSECLKVSASVIDLGMVSWKNNDRYVFEANNDKKYVYAVEKDRKEIEQRLDDINFLDFNLLQFYDKSSTAGKKDKTTRLSPTFTLGAEYGFLNNKLSVGALYTGKFAALQNYNELMLIGNYKPYKNINLTLSYSVFESAGKGIGLAAKLGVFFLGADYLFLGDSTRNINGLVGISIPLGRKK